MDLLQQLRINSLSCIVNCISSIRGGQDSLELILIRLESLLDTIIEVNGHQRINWYHTVVPLLESAIEALASTAEDNNASVVGRPRLQINLNLIEYLLFCKFKVVDIAKMMGVSRGTIFNRMASAGLSVSQTYSQITDEQLHIRILDILTRFPNTGYKRMKGFLLEDGVSLTDQRIRSAMRRADPEGVYHRTLQNRCIVRRQYFVQYFNQLWHLDTNMKLVRWSIIIRSCIDGKSRLVTYLDASADNTAESNLASFLEAVSTYGIPYRTRSDKGGENVLIARFMIEQRGVNRGSHICGRSVHNQRIERHWRDVFYGCTGTFYNVLSALEEDGNLNIDNPKHMYLVHHVFIPRIRESLQVFKHAWNQHPLSTEHNYSPTQLMIMNLPPPSQDLQLGETERADANFFCDRLEDTFQLLPDTMDSITSPPPPGTLNSSELERLSRINVHRHSDHMGYDIFLECLAALIRE